MNASPRFYLRLLASPSIEAGGGTLLTGRVAQRHRIALLALLALAPRNRLSRDKVIAFLWPESDEQRGRNLLNVATYVLRTALGEGALLSASDELWLNGEVVRADVADFEDALERADQARAAALYQAPFLDGFFLSDAPEFEQWTQRERKRLADGYGRALEGLAQKAEAESDFSRAANWWKVRAAEDPYDSRIAVRLMQALEASGNRAGALQHAAAHQRLLQEELGMTVVPEIATLVERLRGEALASSTTPVAVSDLSAPGGERRALPTVPSPTAAVERGAERWRKWLGGVALGVLVLVVAAVWGPWSGVSRPEPSIAVLPFIHLGAVGDSEYFSDGLTEEIITGLSAIPGLKVISRTSAMQYKGTPKSLRQIAQELKVAHVLEGSVRHSGGRVRISAQLIDARTDQHRWAQTYDDDLRDIFRVQEQIAQEVVRALQVELAERGAGALMRQGTRDPEAHQLYRRGRYLWNTRTLEGHERAMEYYQRAIERDSSYADPYAGLADAYLTAYQLNLLRLPEAELYSRMKWAAERALALDSLSADAHTSFAISLQWQRNWPGAEREFRRAIQLNPGNVTARTWYALLLVGFGRWKEALRESRRAHELDPFAVAGGGSNYGPLCYFTRDYDCAVAEQRRTLEIAPSWGPGYQRLGLAYAATGMLEDAIRAVRKAIELAPERPDYVADLAYVQALRGETAAALVTLERAKTQRSEAFNIARAYVALREPDSAFAWLERSSWQWPNRAVRGDPALDPLRSDPRFAQLAARVERDMGIR